MGYIVERGGRFTAYYRHDSKRLSAGTHSTKEKALASLSRAEENAPEGASRASMTLTAYFDLWLPTSDILPITRKGYESVMRRHILPLLGSKKVAQITRRSVRMALDTLKAQGVGNATLAQCKASLGSLYKPLVEAEEVASNPTHGIRIKKNQEDLRNVLDPSEFRSVLAYLPTDGARLFARFLITSGTRFGEASEIRVKDFNFKTNEVYIQRRVSDLGKKRNNGKRFLVVEATKSGHKRIVVMSGALITEVKQYIKVNALEKESLLFPKFLIEPSVTVEVMSRETKPSRPFVLGGKTFSHGTLYAYTNGGCKCEQCRSAVREYRRDYRAKRYIKQSASNDSGHLPRDIWRNIWNRAIDKSDIGWYPRTHDLRHANATSLLKNGVDIHEVKERLGHQSIKTTERYLHRLRHQRSKAGETVNDFLE